MSYAVYTTRGFVLGSAPSGEASKRYSLYTEDFGLIHARAQAVRLLASKLRYNLEDFSFCTFSLVRGKEVWRITGAEKAGGPFPRPLSLLHARVLTLVKRLIHGEEANSELFAVLVDMFKTPPLAKDIHAFESLVLVRTLSSLGYMDSDISSIEDVKARSGDVIREINKALQETQL